MGFDIRHRQQYEKPYPALVTALFLSAILTVGGCAVSTKTLSIKHHTEPLIENTILDTGSASVITRSRLMDHLSQARVVYIGESHTNPSHHDIQLEIIQALWQASPDLCIGMEMFDHTYQPVLDQWVSGDLDEAAFLRQTHWYANWGFNFDLYRDILEYAKEKEIRILALNVPFHIPAKIRVGGIASLSTKDAGHLPATIDTSVADHRSYIKGIYKMHAFGGRSNFDFFYQAQCAWEDAMAAEVADHLGTGKMIVLVGNGHIIRKFGIPDRAFARNPVPFKTVYLAAVGGEAESDWADYLWVTPNRRMPRMPMKKPSPADKQPHQKAR